MLQGDGSRHKWFEERGEEATLLIFVDDATSGITAGKFFRSETTLGYQEILEEHLKRYGRPLGLYVDKHSVFRTSRENSFAKENETHFGRVLRELDIELICAHSPQAKGRVERANGVLQDRLIKEMRIRELSTIEEGNEFLPIFIKDYNKRFKKPAGNEEDAHRSLRSEDDLERIFARRAERKLSKSLSFQYEGSLYQLKPKYPNRFRTTHVTILERPGKALVVESAGKMQEYEKIEEIEHGKPEVLNSKEIEAYSFNQSRKKPSKHHPWR